MRYTSSSGAVLWPVTLTRPAVHLALRVGRGELLSISNGSCFLVGGKPLERAQSGGVVSVTDDPEVAYLHRAGSAYVPSAYGISIPAWEVVGTDGPEVYRLPFARSAATLPRLSLYTSPVQDVTVQVVATDLLTNIGAPGTADLVLEATDASGQNETYTLSVTIDDAPPTGDVQVIWAAGLTYLTYQNLSADAEALLLSVPGQPVVRVSVTEPGEGVCEVETPTLPTAVYAVDYAGNVSRNLIARHLSLGSVGADAMTRTPVSTWPLPPYLNPKRPVLGTLLTAFEAALDIGQDAAGEALSILDARGQELDRLSDYYGLSRRPGELDEALSARIQARFMARKSTRSGLREQLNRVQAGGAVITDLHAYAESSYQLDGSWKLDGSVTLGEFSIRQDVQPGQVAVSLPYTPLTGWADVLGIARTYTAAGVVPQVYHLNLTHAVLGNAPRTELTLQRLDTVPAHKLSALSILAYEIALTLDGRWQLDGAEQIDGTQAPSPKEIQ